MRNGAKSIKILQVMGDVSFYVALVELDQIIIYKYCAKSNVDIM